jgi:Mn-dependent DtxR family transcriptional regulator
MNLTRRQEEFFKNMLELYREFDRPIHYSILADRLGVSPFTAYDMLRLLEEKGLVASEYQLASDKTGPGRAERVFSPTRTAQEWYQKLLVEAGGVDFDDEEINQYILEKLQKGELSQSDLAEEMLARIPPDEGNAIGYCVEVITVIALRMRQSSGKQILLEYLPAILSGSPEACRSNLSLFGGFAFGILAQENTSDQEWVQKLFEYLGKYQEILMQLSMRDCQKLGDYIAAVFKS